MKTKLKHLHFTLLVLLALTVLEVQGQTPPPITAYPMCTYTKLTYSGTPPAGYYYYWQTTPTGTSTINGTTNFNATSTGTYFLRIVNGSTMQWGDYSYVQVYTHTPVANAGADRNTCIGGTQSITIGSTAISGYTYSWSPTTGLSSSTTASPSLVPSANITYTLTVTVGGCTVTDQINVTVSNKPATPVADDVSRCGPGQVTLTATCATPGATILWLYGSMGAGTGPSYTTASLTSNRTFTTVSRLGDCIGQGADNATAIIKPAAVTPEAGNNVTFWSGQSASLGGSAASGHTYSWSPTTGLNSSTIPNPVITLSTATPINTNYVVTADYNGCAATDNVNVIALPIPTVSVTPDCGYTRLTYSPAPAGGYMAFWQSTPDGTSMENGAVNRDVTTPGTYYLRGYFNGLWSATVTTPVTTIKQVAVANAGPDLQVCTGQSATLGVSPTPGFTYAWSPTTGLNAANVSNPTVSSPIGLSATYTLTVTAPGGCTATDQVVVTLCPAVPVANDVSRCGEGPVTLTATCATPGVSIVWMYNGSAVGTGPTFTTGSLTSSKNFTVGAILNGIPSQGVDNVTAIVNPVPVANAGPDKIVWSGASTTLGVAPTAGYSYLWNPTTALSSPTVSNPTITPVATPELYQYYSVTATSNGCSATDYVTLAVLPMPVITQTPFCGYTRLTYSPVPSGNYSGYWQTAPDGTSMDNSATPRDVTSPGNYYLRGYINGVWSPAVVANVTSILQNPTPPDAGSNITAASGEGQQLGTTATPGYTYSWTPSQGLSAANISNPIATPDETTTYTVTATNANGCSASSSVTVSLEYMNWVTSRAYSFNPDGSPKEIASEKNYSDGYGNVTQSQTKSYAHNQVLASQNIYDFNQTPTLTTLPAPINSASFQYRPKFVTNQDNQRYSAVDFDYLPFQNNPRPVSNGGIGSLGWYYSPANTLEPQTPTTSYPYARSYSLPGPDPKQSTAAGPGDAFRMGGGHEAKSDRYLADITDLEHYYSLYPHFIGASPYSNNLLSQVSWTSTASFTASGSVSVSASNGYVTATCNQSTGTPGVLIGGNISVTPGQSYTFRIKGYRATAHTANLYVATAAGVAIKWVGTVFPSTGSQNEQWISQAFTVPAGVTLIKVGVLWSGPATNASFILSGADLRLGDVPRSPGYKFVSTDPNGKKTVSFVDADGNDIAAATITSSTTSAVSPTFTYTQWSYAYYNNIGQTVATVAPNGVNTASTAYPQYATLYKYDNARRLIETNSTDEGISQFVYSTDGKLRFSENQEQRNASVKRFSYTNYDYLGRAIESGEYTGSGTNPYVFQPHTATSSGNSILSVIDNTGFTGVSRKVTAEESRCADYTFVAYDQPSSDFPDTSNPQQNLFGEVSRTENENAITWYTYDEFGQLTKSYQKLLMSLNIIKTVEYTYDYQGNATTVAYQKDQAGEAFYHHYEYDADQRLTKVETSIDGIGKTLQARYYYYLHGPLKRVELGTSLQGIDYAYNIDGSLKVINHADPAKDPGQDGISGSNAAFMTDIFGETLDYHTNDYSGAGYDEGNLTLSTHPDQFGGALKAIRWHSAVDAHSPRIYAFTYDNLYQMTNATWGDMTGTAGAYGFTASATQAYKEDIGAYDKNGNIQSLVRTGKLGNTLANYGYTYSANTNKLAQVSHNGSPLLNYQYNAIGQMTQQTEGSSVMKVSYTPYGLVREVRDGSNQLKVSYSYDDRGNRIRKTVYTGGNPVKNTFYIYDAVGNVLAIYEQTLPADSIQLTEVPVYGGSRIGVFKPLVNTTFYEISDHLGNVRGVIGQPATTSYNANFENSAQGEQINTFQNYSRSDLDLFDHTDTGASYTYAQLLTGGNNSQVGLAKTLKVSPGDVITARAYAKYRNIASTSSNLTGFGAALVGAFGLTPTATGEGALAYNAINNYGGIVAGGYGPGDSSGPKAFITLLLFDKNYNLVDAAWDQLSNDAEQTGTTTKAPHEHLYKEVTVTEPGYAYIFVSNENPTVVDVYFDDVSVTLQQSPIVAGADYYPFGLEMEDRAITDEPYRYGYQGQFSEKNNDTGHNEFELRFYDAKIGRWLSADPYGQYYSPYMAMGNRPHMNVDPDGGLAGPGGGLLWKWVANPTTIDNLAGYWTRTLLGNILTAAPGMVATVLREAVQSDESKKFHYFTDESKAIQFMIDKQSKDKKEVSAIMVRGKENKNMIIVQPWHGNTEHSASSWNDGVVPDDEQRRVIIKGITYGKLLASIHTHPPGGSYEGPSGPGNASSGGHGDYGVWQGELGKLNMFIIGPTEVSKLNPTYPFKKSVWSDTKSSYNSGNRHKIGSTNDLLNGNFSLFNFLGL